MLNTSVSNNIDNSKNNIIQSKSVQLSPLKYSLINFSSQDPLHPINNLLKAGKDEKIGWISARYCPYPQEILIEFSSKVNLRQINILINESKIPKIIEVINCIPITEDNKFIFNNNNNSRIIPNEFKFENIGYIKLSPNTKSKYRARELRKIHINIKTKYIKLKLYKNYTNDLNVFCQVGIALLEFFGIPIEDTPLIDNSKILGVNKSMDNIEILNSSNFKIDNIDENFIEKKMDKQTSDKLKELIEEMNKKKENEEYDDCKLFKDKIDRIRRISLKIYSLEEQKKECANNNDFDKALNIKTKIEQIKNFLHKYIVDNDNKYYGYVNQTINSQSPQEIYKGNLEIYDNLILPSVIKRLQRNNNSFNRSGSLSGDLSNDTIEFMDEDKDIEKDDLEDIDNMLKIKYSLIIKYVGEDVVKKIFSKHIYYQEEGFNALKAKVKDIINDQKDTAEANKYIVLLMDIIYNFLDNKHPSIVYKCLNIFSIILEAIVEKSKESKILYNFSLNKRILNKIKEKLNDISKKVRNKAIDVYCFMLETNFCEYNTLLVELIENEVVSHFSKYIFFLNKNNGVRSKYTNKLFYFENINSKFEIRSSRQLIITKMEIFLRALNNFDDAVENNKTDKQKFPSSLLGDFIIMYINHPKDDVREITKDVLIKYIDIFGNGIIKKMLMVMDEKEINKIFQDKEELKNAFDNFKKDEKNKTEKNISDKNNNSLINQHNNSSFNFDENIFLTNVNKKFPQKNKLKPIELKVELLRANKQIKMMRSISQPRYGYSKNKLKPISTRVKPKKILINSKSSSTIENT